ncbi:DUF11 domain-containing protein [Paucibacter sp. TC2R-5]|uniref:DUF11 domain-containing protein n=1 Tax=Paucibacter sp. TC2R-5 TaxID=2893555 RepID=UPI0021E3921E|nr:DUF11 domain-containing protein [Paucibacter sp. TC2R-5]MCV2360154.1 DUF11 domain-containing protein [Paucibacter sp. TC2R-5]
MFTPSVQLNQNSSFRPFLLGLSLSAAVLLSACGGGGGGSDGGGTVVPPPPVDGPDLMVTADPTSIGEIPSGTAQTMIRFKLSNVGKGAAVSTDFNIVADALLQDMKVLNCKSDNAGTACPTILGSRMAISNLLPGTTLSFDVFGTVKSGTSGTVNFEASANSTGAGQLSSSKQAVGLKAYTVDVGVQVTGPTAPVPLGDSFEFVVTVGNQGPDAAKGVDLILTASSIPVGTAPSLGAMTCTASGGAVCPTALSVAKMTLPNVPKDGSLVFKLPYSFAPGQSAKMVFNADLTAKGDNNLSNNSFTLLTP